MTFQALLFCPDEKTARVTTQVLTELEFSVEACTEPFAAVKKLMGQHFDAIVVDCDNEQNASLLFKSARNSTSNQASLAVAVVEGQSGVANAFRIGANLVLTKPINVEQAKSTLRVARGLLRKGGEASKPVGAGSPRPTSPTTPGTEKSTSAALPTPPSAAAVRSTVANPSAAKPSIPAMAALKAQPAPAAMAKTPSEAAKLDPHPATSANASDDLFESSEGAVANQPTSSQKYPWQPVSKPTGRVGTPLSKASTPAGKKESVPAFSERSIQTAPPTKETRSAFASSVMTLGRAASAPAPAKETPKPQMPTTTLEAEQALATTAPSAKPTAAPAAKPTMRPTASDALTEAPAKSAPTFAALDLSEEASTSAGNKKGILVAAVIVALAIAGYVGYAKFHVAQRITSNPATGQVSTAPTADASTVESTPAPSATATPSATVVATPLPATKPQPPSTSTPSTKASSSEDEEDVTVTHPDVAPPLVVKSGLGAKPAPKAAPANEVAAPTLGMNDDQSAISNIVQSASVAVPKVATPQQTLKVSQGVTQGLLTRRVQPVYPPQALQMHIQGAVQMLATINKEGKITSVKVLSGDPILSRAATDAVSQWRYKPYFLNGEPVEIHTQIVVNFRLP